MLLYTETNNIMLLKMFDDNNIILLRVTHVYYSIFGVLNLEHSNRRRRYFCNALYFILRLIYIHKFCLCFFTYATYANITSGTDIPAYCNVYRQYIIIAVVVDPRQRL